jgi:hypothetical protein
MKYIHNTLFSNEWISNSSDTKLFVKLFSVPPGVDFRRENPRPAPSWIMRARRKSSPAMPVSFPR